MVAWSALSLAPDLDVIGFCFGVAYGAPWGHRGATHSLLFAMVLGGVLGALSGSFGLPRLRTTVSACAALASHGLLDTLTQGGLGCALLWPWSHTRYLAPIRLVPAAPIGARFSSSAGLRVALLELAWCWPLLLYALWPRRRPQSRSANGNSTPNTL